MKSKIRHCEEPAVFLSGRRGNLKQNGLRLSAKKHSEIRRTDSAELCGELHCARKDAVKYIGQALFLVVCFLPRFALADGAINLGPGMKADGTITGDASGARKFQGEISIKKKNAMTSEGCAETAFKFLCVQGNVFASMTGSIPLEDLSRGPAFTAAALDGAVDWRDGAVYPINVALEVLQQVAQIPGMEPIKGVVMGNPFLVPRGAGTRFQLLRVLFLMEGGVIHFLDVVLKSPDYLIQGDGGYVYAEDRVTFQGRFILLPAGSSRLVALIPALGRVQNAAGRLSFPFSLKGSLSHPILKAELGSLSAELLKSYRKELIRQGEQRQGIYK